MNNKSMPIGLTLIIFLTGYVSSCRCNDYLRYWEVMGCNMVEMKCSQHDKFAARSQFISHFLARMIYAYNVEETPIDTTNVITIREYSKRLTEDHSFDLFSGLYRYNKYTHDEIAILRDALDEVEQCLLQSLAQGGGAFKDENK